MFHTKKAKRAVTSILAAAWVLIGASSAQSEDFQIPQQFKPGDVISADVMNEIFSYISLTKKPIQASELVGSWKCQKYHAGDVYPAMNAYYTTVTQGGLWHSLDIQLTIQQDVTGTFSWNSGNQYNAFTMGAEALDKCAGQGAFDVFNDKVAVTTQSCPTPVYPAEWATYVYEIRRLSGTQIEFSKGAIAGYTPATFLRCDKQNIPPQIPSNLSSQLSNAHVSLSWTDNSNDETGFKILRKTNLTDNFEVIATVDTDVTTYEDTLSSSDTYWYRVIATNGNGDSLGSNEVRVMVGN